MAKKCRYLKFASGNVDLVRFSVLRPSISHISMSVIHAKLGLTKVSMLELVLRQATIEDLLPRLKLNEALIWFCSCTDRGKMLEILLN